MQVDQGYGNIAAEFPQDLAAGTARWGERFRIGRDRDAAELARAFGDGFEDGDALGTDCKAVGRVFDVAAGVDAPGLVFDCGAHQEVGVGRVGMEACGESGILKRVGHVTTLAGSSLHYSREICPARKSICKFKPQRKSSPSRQL